MHHWVPLLQWGIPILLPAVGLWFGWHKWRVDRQDQYDLRFYDERREIYNVVMAFGLRIIQDRNVTREDLISFAECIKERPYLLSESINHLLDQLYEQALGVILSNAETRSEHVLAFADILDTVPAQFERYLTVKK